jgi:IS605 OrfB family transposase
MKTIKLKISIPDEWKALIESDQRIYSSIVRYSFNRLKEGIPIKNVYNDCIHKFKLGSHFINCANREAKGIINRFKEIPKYHFGGSALSRLYKGLITKAEYKKSRNLGVFSEGEVNYKGNRYFKIDLQNKTIIYKRSKKEHIPLVINQWLRDKQIRVLESMHICMENKITPITFKLKEDCIFISYDETVVEKYKQFKSLKENRILGIDLNPDYFGISVIEFNKDDSFKIIHKEVIDISSLNDESTNKVKFELQQINNKIIHLCNYYKCSTLSVEDLKFKKSKKLPTRYLNRLCKNKFRYSTIKLHLSTLCNTYGVKFVEINAAYSSVVGNLNYGNNSTPDMVAASIEIARRAYKKFSKGWFYPALNKERVKEVLINQWKKDLELNFNSWPELSNQIKKLGLKYRFQLDGSMAVFSKYYKKKFISLYRFI